MIYHIVIPVEGGVETDLSLRYLLVDTIEDRGVGSVLEEGTGEDGMHVVVQLPDGRGGAAEAELRSLIGGLGLGGASIERVDE